MRFDRLNYEIGPLRASAIINYEQESK